MISRPGVTLVELLVALALLAVVAGVASVSLRAPSRRDAVDPLAANAAEARRQALAQGVPATREFEYLGMRHALTALPDGRVISDVASRDSSAARSPR